MSREYDIYLTLHKNNVEQGFRWIQNNLPELLIDISGVDYEHQICFEHDASKTERDEYDAYDAYFYGKKNNRSYSVVQDFNYAWLRHIHRNPHHWQAWVLINDNPDEGEIVMDMPYNYVIEMICDWWSFSWKTGNLREIYDWYKQRYYHIKLSDNTRRIVDDILKKINLKLTELESEE